MTEPAQSSLVEFKTFPSKKAGSMVSYHVYLPPDYTNWPDRKFPVIYWLHGSGPAAKGIPFIAAYFDQAIRNGLMPPVLVVFPNGLPAGMWVDSKDGVQPVEGVLIDELIPLIDQTYRTLDHRAGRLLAGFSMGGYGAARLGLKHSDKFQSAAMFAAGPLQQDFLALDPDLQPLPLRRMIFEKVYGNDRTYFQESSPRQMALDQSSRLPPDFRIQIVVGAEDPLLKNNVAYRDHLNELKIPNEFRQLPNIGHDPQEVLGSDLPSTMKFFQEVLTIPAP